jgi:hypothetical protein
MTAIIREEVSLTLRADALETLRGIAKAEARTEQSLFDEAVDDLIGKHAVSTASAHVMNAYHQSTRTYDGLYKALAR